jgi:hypothetical protein
VAGYSNKRFLVGFSATIASVVISSPATARPANTMFEIDMALNRNRAPLK